MYETQCVAILWSSQNIFQTRFFIEKNIFFCYYFIIFSHTQKKNVVSIISAILAMVVYLYVNGMVSNHANMAHLDLMMMMMMLCCLLVCLVFGQITIRTTAIPVRLFKLHGFIIVFRTHTHTQFLCSNLNSSLHTNKFMRLHHTSNECRIRLTLIYTQVHCNLHYELLRKIYNIFYGEKEEL